MSCYDYVALLYTILKNIPRATITVSFFSIKSLHMALQQQSLILTQLANRFDVHLPTTAMPTTSSGIPPYHPDVKINPSSDSLAIYDGSAPGNIVMDRRRQRSVRASMMKSERPKSTVI